MPILSRACTIDICVCCIVCIVASNAIIASEAASLTGLLVLIETGLLVLTGVLVETGFARGVTGDEGTIMGRIPLLEGTGAGCETCLGDTGAGCETCLGDTDCVFFFSDAVCLEDFRDLLTLGDLPLTGEVIPFVAGVTILLRVLSAGVSAVGPLGAFGAALAASVSSKVLFDSCVAGVLRIEAGLVSSELGVSFASSAISSGFIISKVLTCVYQR